MKRVSSAGYPPAVFRRDTNTQIAGGTPALPTPSIQTENVALDLATKIAPQLP